MEKASLIKGIEILNATARLAVSQDLMAVRIYAISDGFEPSTLNDIEHFMKEFGITAQLLPCIEQENDHWVVARGIEPVNGEDGRIEMCVNTRKNSHASVEREGLRNRNTEAVSGIIDPRDRNFILNVKKDTCIARKIPPGKGVRGKNVLGEVVPATPGKHVTFNTGIGVKIGDDDTALYATVDGGIHVEDATISVFDEWEIDCSVGMATGHVEFAGRLLTIKGSVSGGFRVSADGNIIIMENIEDAATVEAGGDLYVKGLVGAQKTIVKAGGKITCMAVEYAELNAAGDIIVQDYLLDATCMAGGNVTVTSGKGLVAGGKVLLGGSFEGKIMGTPANVPTMIHAGFNPRIKKIYEDEVHQLKKYAQKRCQLQAALSKIERVCHKGSLTEKLEKIKTKIKEGLSSIAMASEEKMKLVEELEAQMGMLVASTVKIQQKAYPNSKICIDNAQIVLKKEVDAVLLSFRQGRVVLSTIN